jgi:hypothetical protein
MGLARQLFKFKRSRVPNWTHLTTPQTTKARPIGRAFAILKPLGQA